MSSTFPSEPFGILPLALHTQLRESPNRVFAQTATIFERTRHTLLSDRNDDQTRFQDALTLKAFIDGASEHLNDRPIDSQDGALLKRCAAVLNAEYVLFHLYKDVQLPVNPFLSHWVDNIARWEGKGVNTVEDSGTTPVFQQARLYLARTLLMEEYPSKQLSDLSPMSLLDHSPKSPKFSIESWIKTFPPSSPIFYDPDALTIFKNSVSALYPSSKFTPESNSLPSQLKAPQRLKLDDLLIMFKEDQEQTTFAIIHMPIDDIQCLELVNNLLTRNEEDGLLYKLGVDIVGMVRDYIQHGLRQIETLGGEVDGSGGGSSHTEEQLRAVKLLHLFIRNLLLKGFITVDQIRFELLELGMRYVWVKEVREDALLANSGISLWAD